MSEADQARTKAQRRGTKPHLPQPPPPKKSGFYPKPQRATPSPLARAFFPTADRSPITGHLPRSCGSEWPIKGLNVLSSSAFRSLPELPPLEQKYSSSAASLTSLMAEKRGPQRPPTAPAPPDTEEARLPGGVHSSITPSPG